MSQMPQQAAPAKCPSCAEPLESGDLFCGACGYDLSAVPAAPQDHPTLTMGSSGVAWPPPDPDNSGPTTAPHLPSDLPGTDSGGKPLPGSAPHGASASGVRFDRPPAPDDDYALQAPDPRVAASATESAETAELPKVCVACRAGRVDDDGYCENCGHAQPRERDHMEQESGPVAAVSDRGLRHHRNEDAFSVGRTTLPDGTPAVFAVVCDGVSSATRPDEASLAASRAASEALLAALPQGTHPQAAMHEAIVAASEAVNSLAEEPPEAREHTPHQNAPACTLVGSVVAAGLLVVGWVGDSRVYWVPVDRDAPPARLTEDDSWAAQMVAAGLMSEAEAYADERAHAITGWLGADAYELEPHTASFKPDRPGVVVVCTDGLWNYAESAEEMAEVMPGDAAARPLHAARVLVGHALDGGGHDNVTVALVPFPAPPRGAGSA
ncbi:PP2C family serine/threonine-protein phosphatase [Streptomyces sp. NPDC101237]|uniref:PP2C family serine/threonine-protein phosphatase n=1 Tax=Streptomyces sp. NPDC101237 TaxID=3366139 RepID=UPI0037FC9559